jgi:hypothetical protein
VIQEVLSTMKKTFFFSLVVVLLASCRTSPPTGDGKDSTSVGDTTINGNGTKDAAIDGIVLKGPIYPVERPGIINVAPLPGAPVTITSNGNVIAKVVSDTGGHFYVHVAAGTYTCTPEPYGNSQLPRPEGPSTVVVPAKTVVRDTLHYDTGIR